MPANSFISETAASLKTPFASMTWTQLAAVTVFVLTVALGWRQVVLFIGQEI